MAGIVANSFAPIGGATRLNHFIGQARAEDAPNPIYFQDPDGKPLYSLTPKKTPDGRDYLGVPAGAGVSFDEPPQTKAAVEPADRKIKYYRNPMGLPDISPVPKKDSMGMDYIPVYEGDDSDDGSVKTVAGKNPAHRRQVGAGRHAHHPHDDPCARHHSARRAPHLGDRDAGRKLHSEG